MKYTTVRLALFHKMHCRDIDPFYSSSSPFLGFFALQSPFRKSQIKFNESNKTPLMLSVGASIFSRRKVFLGLRHAAGEFT